MIDADTHVIESETTWDFLEGKDKLFRPDFIKGESRFTRGWTIGGHFVWGDRGNDDLPWSVREMTDPDTRIKFMNDLGVDVQIIYPSVLVTPFTTDTAIQVALCRAYNRFMANATRQHRKRLRWAVAVPTLNIDEAIDEIIYGHANGASAVMLRGIETNCNIYDECLFPLFEKSQDLNLAICIHSGNGNKEIVDALGDDFYSAFVLPVVSAFNGLLNKKIPSIFPKLRWGFIEAGAMWVPMLIREMNRRFDKLGGGEILREDSVVSDQNFFITTRTDNDLPYILKWSSPHNLIIGTDFGHEDVQSEIDALEKLRTKESIGSEVIDNILISNPRNLYAI